MISGEAGALLRRESLCRIRSEEHTSELQSQSNLVCRLLLEKKKRVLRRAAPTVGWTPVALPQAADDTAMRLIELYQHRDPALLAALTPGLQLDNAAQGDEP